ncbi:AAA family ATPase [Algoriphagus pacificus]|uniref:AAA family ATPase n=1 Tax=Algoriphagus pacificus TaxID=2811234 RepID=A0ABS3CNM3_9BACT|nr:AAA family ATPase [Algoriphagus pacificus]MBN7818066.1 AAA family ATPase [Algoriphagus pacificus]
MNQDNQHSIASIALDFINHTYQNVFLTGGAGTGKTTFLKILRSQTHKKLAIAAPTGVAAVNAGGITIHSLFGLPARPLDNGTVKNIHLSGQSKSLLRELELLVIDEASMLRADVLDAMDYLLKEVRQDLRPLGGLQIVLIGDLFQLPPIETRKDAETLQGLYQNLYFINAKTFPGLNMLMLELTEIYRQSDPVFINLLNAIRRGRLLDNELEMLNSLYSPDWFQKEAVILTTHNRYVSEVNDQRLKSLPGLVYTFPAEITGDFFADNAPVDNILQLKIGCRVMVIKNDNTGNSQFFNGKVGLVSVIDNQAIEVKFDDGTIITFNREIWSNVSYATDAENDSLKEVVIGTFKQFPLKLAWAITVHKSQGLTFEKAVIDIAEAFAPGQVYVALSRIRMLKGVFLKSTISSSVIIAPPITETMFLGGSDIHKIKMKLREDKKAYMKDFLFKSFQWDQLNYATIPINASDTIIKNVHDVSEKLQGYASTFLDKANQYIYDENWKLLSDRLVQAETYFSSEINLKCIGLLKDFIKKEKDDFKFRADINRMKNYVKLFQEKISGIALACKVAKGVAEGVNYLPHEITAPKKTALNKVIPTTQLRSTSISTEAQSLKLFLSGDSIAEIASRRSLGIPAIEAHLASYIPTGEVNLVDIVPQDILNEILPLVRQIKSPSIARLRPVSAGKLSMGQLQALNIYLKTFHN